MKKILFGLTLILSASVISVSAQSVATTAKPVLLQVLLLLLLLVLKSLSLHMISVLSRKGTPVSYNFVFTNTGKAPLVLSNAVGSCGCTAAEWPKEAIAPGKTGVIKVTYNAASAKVHLTEQLPYHQMLQTHQLFCISKVM
jgi:hypothetical protein